MLIKILFSLAFVVHNVVVVAGSNDLLMRSDLTTVLGDGDDAQSFSYVDGLSEGESLFVVKRFIVKRQLEV